VGLRTDFLHWTVVAIPLSLDILGNGVNTPPRIGLSKWVPAPFDRHGVGNLGAEFLKLGSTQLEFMLLLSSECVILFLGEQVLHGFTSCIVL
jgi:hypothetical protein